MNLSFHPSIYLIYLSYLSIYLLVYLFCMSSIYPPFHSSKCLPPVGLIVCPSIHPFGCLICLPVHLSIYFQPFLPSTISLIYQSVYIIKNMYVCVNVWNILVYVCTRIYILIGWIFLYFFLMFFSWAKLNTTNHTILMCAMK